MTDAQVINLIDRHTTVRQQLADRVGVIVRRLWDQLDDPYDAAIASAFITQVVNAVRAGQVQTSALTEAYLAQSIAVMTGDVVPLDLRDSPYPRPVSAESVYERSLMSWRYLVSIGKDIREAKLEAGERLLLTADTDLTLSMRDTANEFMNRHSIDRYFRVTRGESNTCDLCYLASTRTYYKSDLLPIHNRCRCAVVPDVSSINLQQVNGVKPDVTQQYVTRYHGELGPVLTVKGEHFRSEAEAIADAA
jgi:hypothetical protein